MNQWLAYPWKDPRKFNFSYFFFFFCDQINKEQIQYHTLTKERNTRETRLYGLRVCKPSFFFHVCLIFNSFNYRSMLNFWYSDVYNSPVRLEVLFSSWEKWIFMNSIHIVSGKLVVRPWFEYLFHYYWLWHQHVESLWEISWIS